MRTDDFWAVIDRATAERPASPGDVAKRAAAELATCDPAEIVAWDRHFSRVMAASGKEDLWAAAYLINGGCSDDGFDNFRGWLIAHGRDAVARAVREPDSLAEMSVIKMAWGPAQVEELQYLRVFIRGLRQKLEPDPTRPTCGISTTRTRCAAASLASPPSSWNRPTDPRGRPSKAARPAGQGRGAAAQ